MSQTTTTTTMTQEQFAGAVEASHPWYAVLSPEQQAASYAEYTELALESEDGYQALTLVLECMAEGKDAYVAALEVAAEDTDTEPTAEATVTEDKPEVAPVVEEPTHTVAEYQALLTRWGKLVGQAAEANYAYAMTAYTTVRVYCGVHPGKAQRSSAVAELARRAVEADPEADALFPPHGKDPAKWYAECVKSSTKTVLGHVQGGALLSLLFGATLETPVVCTDGIARKSASRANPALPWRRVRELFPLVRRVNPTDEHREVWDLLPYVGEDVLALVRDMLAGLKAEDVVTRTRKLVVESLEKRLAGGDKSVLDELERWRGKLEPKASKPAVVATPVAAAAAAKPVTVTADAADAEADDDTTSPTQALAVTGAPADTTDVTVGDKTAPTAGLIRTADHAADADALAAFAYDALCDADDLGDAMVKLVELAKDDEDMPHAVHEACKAFILTYARCTSTATAVAKA